MRFFYVILFSFGLVNMGCDSGKFSASSKKQPSKSESPENTGSGKPNDDDSKGVKSDEDRLGDPLAQFRSDLQDLSPDEIVKDLIPTCFKDKELEELESTSDGKRLEELENCLEDNENLSDDKKEDTLDYIDSNEEDVLDLIQDYIDQLTKKQSDSPSDIPGSIADKINGNDGNDGDANSDEETPEEKAIKEELEKLPGQNAVKVGVNFEDNARQDSDMDFNDAVLCFEGNFKVSEGQIFSLKKQSVKSTTFSASGCKHDVKVVVKSRDGKVEFQKRFSSKSNTPFNMPFKVGSQLFVDLLVAEESKPGCSDANLATKKRVKAQVNFCNKVADKN